MQHPARRAYWEQESRFSLFIWFDLSSLCSLGFLQTQGLGKTQAPPTLESCLPSGNQGLVFAKGWKTLAEAGIALPGLSVLQLASRNRSFLGCSQRLPRLWEAGFGLGAGDADLRADTPFMEAKSETPRERVGERTEVCAPAGAARAPRQLRRLSAAMMACGRSSSNYRGPCQLTL